MANIVTPAPSAIDSSSRWQVAEQKRQGSGNPATDPAAPVAATTDVTDTRRPATAEPNDVGTALRNAFRATLDEDIPAEMLDLLKRLD